MGRLPYSRNQTYNPGAAPAIAAQDLVDIQDGEQGNFYGDSQLGDQSDGNVCLDGVTAYPFASGPTLSDGAYVYTLTRALNADTLIGQAHPSGTPVELAGDFPIRARWTIPRAGFFMSANGAGGGSLPAGGAGGTSGTHAAGNGANTTASLGGSGGKGSDGTGGAGGTGGVATQLTASQGLPRDPTAPGGFVFGNGALTGIQGGAGGGGGGGDGSSSGPVGGQGGGVGVLATGVLDLSNADAGFIRAPGLAGADGIPINAGGGGGGGGGYWDLRYGVLIGAFGRPLAGFVNVAGGAGGRSNTGTNGTVGNSGSFTAQQLYVEPTA